MPCAVCRVPCDFEVVAFRYDTRMKRLREGLVKGCRDRGAGEGRRGSGGG